MRTKIVRIFNTSGPRIRYGPEYGRVIPNFIFQALHDEDITVFGDGSQTRSFIYVVDEIEGLLKIVHYDGAIGEVINLGNNKEFTIIEIANIYNFSRESFFLASVRSFQEANNNYFDVILCSHVLEHIPNDYLALKELYRVLKPKGWAILQVPIDHNRAKTFENSKIISPKERLRVFGQKDHVRIYGTNYKDRLERVGFIVKLDNFAKKNEKEKSHTNLYPKKKVDNISIYFNMFYSIIFNGFYFRNGYATSIFHKRCC
ncbi:hypothetical protein LCGC14_2120580 [marine sediment metagenome]|uniref:NAD-dependent epimerase/dehydratase domain-containing protein n=1 Tax=marine sediment metagenome TaxID=412755 RepID=A0A0F9E4E8_9ZZZZ